MLFHVLPGVGNVAPTEPVDDAWSTLPGVGNVAPTEPVDDAWSTLLNALRHNRERPGSGTNARLAQLADDLLESLRGVFLRDMTSVDSLVLEILAEHGYILGEFANQFEHELTATHMERLETDLRSSYQPQCYLHD
jgi:hypothetical protein